MTEQAYRGTQATLDAERRDEDATREIAEWRSRTLTRILLGFTFAGLPVAVCAIGLALSLQQQLTGYGSLRVSMLVGIAVWIAVMAIGRAVARLVVRRRTPAAVARIAARHDVPIAGLAETARDADKVS